MRLILRLEHPLESKLYRKYSARTMIGQSRFIDNLVVGQRVEDIPGAVVECGTWRGGMIAALAESLKRGQRREFVLFDSFQGLPPAADIDGETARAWQSDRESPNYHNNCRAEVDEARESMHMAGVTPRIIEGWFDDTVPRYAVENDPEIALLRLDGDWYDSTIVCLRHLFPLVVPGGVVIIDDYGTWDGCTRAVHDFLSEIKATEFLRRTKRGVIYLIRR